MALIADDVSKADAPPFAFALEAELRPLEAHISRLRRSDRVEETRKAVRNAAQRIESLAKSAGRVDLADLASGLYAYLDNDPWTKTTDSFVDAQVLCAAVDVFNAKLPGVSERTDSSELEAFVRARFHQRAAARPPSYADFKPPAPPAREEPAAPVEAPAAVESPIAPWTTMDQAIERSWEAELTNDDLFADEPPVMVAPTEESADALDQMIHDAFPELEAAPQPAAETPSAPETKRGRKKKDKGKVEKKSRRRGKQKQTEVEPVPAAETAPAVESQPDADAVLEQLIAESVPEAAIEAAPPELEAAVEADVVEAAEAPLEAAVEIQATEVQTVLESPTEPAAVLEAPVAEVVAEAPAEPVAEAIVETKPEKKSKRGRRGRKSEEPQAPAAVESSAEREFALVEPEIVETFRLGPPAEGDSVLDRVPTSTILDGWDLGAADRDAWMEEHHGVLGRLRSSVNAVKAAPSDDNAMLDLAAAIDEYRAAAQKSGRTSAAEFAAKLGELPWRLAEGHSAAPTETVELLRNGVRALIDLATGFYDPTQLQGYVDSVEKALAPPTQESPSAPESVVAEPTSEAPIEPADEAPAPVAEVLVEETVEAAASDAEEERILDELEAPAEVLWEQESAVGETETVERFVAEPTQVEATATEDPVVEVQAFVAATVEPVLEASPEAELETAPPEVEAVAEEKPAQGPASTNLLALFENETGELLTSFEGCVEALASNPHDREAVDKAYITAHTYVGAAATVGFTDCSRIAGMLESILERIQAGTAAWDAEANSLLYLGIQLLRQRRANQALAPFAVASFSEQCAEWISVQENPPPLSASAEDFSAHESYMHQSDAEASHTGAAFDLLAGVSDAELDLGDVPAELLEVYTEEAEEHLKLINVGLGRLRDEPNNRELVQEVRRSAHTLKGAAGAVGLRAVAKLAHRMEDLLDQLYEGARTVEPGVYDLLRRSTDLLGDLSTGVRKPDSAKGALNELFDRYNAIVDQSMLDADQSDDAAETPTEEPVSVSPEPDFPEPVFPSLPVAIDQTPSVHTEVPLWPARPAPTTIRTQGAAPREESHQTRRTGNMLRVPIERIDDLVRLVSELVINRTAFEQRMAEFVRLVEDLKGSSSRLRATSVELQNEYEANAHRTGRSLDSSLLGNTSTVGDGRFAVDFDALEFDRYTDFHLLTRALAESTGDVGTLSSELANLVGDFDALLNRQSRLSRAIQDRLMRTRMVALTSLATRLERTVRTAADSLGKKVELELRGDATELDKTVLEEMIDPLLHLLRNCVDHGIENEAERLSQGKSGAGKIFIHAYYQGTQVVIQVGDDGRGIEPEKLRTAAVRGGFLSAPDAAEADLEGLHQLLFAPGFSTAGEVSEISGRGVGLDVVRSRVAKLKGSIAVDSTVGKGTTFSIRLPMTLAIVRSLLVSAHGKTFAIPIQAVGQIIRVEKSAIGKVADGRVIFHNGRVFSLFQLGKTLGLPTLTDEEPAVMPVLITYAGTREVAVQVDKIVAAREVVVKTLGTHLRRVHGMIGATVMGDGAVVPILNLPELYARARSETGGPAVVRPRVPFGTKSADSMRVMIVDDSVSVRRVVSTIIKGQGWTPIQAKDGLDAFEQLQKSPIPPDAILLDVEMPRMSGYELLATLRSQEKFRDVPVVMVTSRAGEKHRRKAMELGANEYTVKPFLEDALVALLRKLTLATAKA